MTAPAAQRMHLGQLAVDRVTFAQALDAIAELEPRRLWRRYLVRDPKFLGILLGELRAQHALRRRVEALP